MSKSGKQHEQRFAVYPEIYGQRGELNLGGLIAVARQNGMEVIKAFHVGLCVWASIALFGTQTQMRKTERAWLAAGHRLKPRSADGWKVSTMVPRADWAEVSLRRHEARAIPTAGGKRIRLGFGIGMVVAPPNYRELTERELPGKRDIAYVESTQTWAPVDLDALRKYGRKFFKAHASVLRRVPNGRSETND